MTTTTQRPGIDASDRPRILPTAAQPGSLAAALVAGDHRTILLLPGIDTRWPAILGELLIGRPVLSQWVHDVVSALDAWAATPEPSSLGQFPDGFAPLVAAAASDDPRAGTGPALVVGSILVNSVSVMTLEEDGLAGWADLPGATVAGHSAGQLAARLVAGRRDAAGQIPVEDALRVAQIAVLGGAYAGRHPWAVSQSAVAAALAGDEHAPVPVVAVTGPRTAQLSSLLVELADRLPDEVVIGVTNSPTRNVLVGRPAALAELRRLLDQRSRRESELRAAGRFGGTPLHFTWQPLPFAVPTHHPDLTALAETAVAECERMGLDLPTGNMVPILDPATGSFTPTPAKEARAALVHSQMSLPHDWDRLIADLPAGTVGIVPSTLAALAGMTASAGQGRGLLVVDAGTAAGRTDLFAAGRAPQVPQTWQRFAPRVVRTAGGALRLANRHTAWSGRSPMILPGMTPTTADAPIVAAAANGGHVAELAGGGQVSERIFTERLVELAELLDPGQEVVLNTLHMDPYLWGLHIGRQRLLFKARAAGAPIAGVTISAGVPERAEALELLEELNRAGLWLNAFKPGTTAQVAEVLAIAAATPHRVWIHLEGGAAGGHHSWEDLDELLLATYPQIRRLDNVVLAVGGGVSDPQRAADLLTGTWALAHGAPVMPVDAVLLGTVTMATLEATTSASVKAALEATQGYRGWVTRGRVAGGTTSGRSGLDADIHFLDNSASRTARLLDEVAGDARLVEQRRDEIVTALAATAKPYFGDVADLTYAELLERFVELAALGRDGRYEDGAWLDASHRALFIELLQRAEARLDRADTGLVATLFDDPASVDDPQAALACLLRAHPAAATALVHPADADHFLVSCRASAKPVPFVPVLDADVRRWYQSDSLWQSHSDRYDADQVLVIPGPVAVAGISTVDEPVAALLDRFEAGCVETLAEPPLPAPDFRLAFDGHDHGDAVLRAALAAPTWLWLDAARVNPLHLIAAPDRWELVDGIARWTGGAESATLAPDGEGLRLTIAWPGLGLPGDGSLSLPVAVRIDAGTVVFAVGSQALDAAGRQLPSGDARGGAVSHAATVGGTGELPDHVMARLWPVVFGALRDAGLADTLFDLVHQRHEIRRAPVAVPGVSAPQVSRVEGGLLVEVAASTAGTEVVDRFFVRRTRTDPALDPAAPAPGLTGVVDTPLRTLGSLLVTAPQQLDSFAQITGDLNPIHRSDALARFVGLPGRIVHGMWTSAAATRAVIELAADGDGERLQWWSIEFMAPVLPGQQVTFALTRIGMRDGARVVSVQASTDDGIVATGTAVVAPPRTMYVFPGQGIQSRGMGMDGYARSAAARGVWDDADRITRERLGFSILEVVRDNPSSIEAVGRTFRHPVGVLDLTQFTQVAMATLASAQVAELRESGALDPRAAVAGHSVGEYNALAACSGGLPLPALIELVFARGMAMHGLVPRDAEGRSGYRLAVVRPHLAGLTHAQAEQLVAEVAEQTGQLCEIVNHNLRGKQYAVAASVAAVQVLAERLGAGSPGRPPLLLVPGIDVPFHSSVLSPGVAQFRQHLQDKLPLDIDAHSMVGRYIPNLYPVAFRLDRSYVEGVQAVCHSPVLADLLQRWDDEPAADRARVLVIELLAWQFASPVRWIETFELACTPVAQGGLGVERIVEIGVGAAPTLANLAKGSLQLASHRGTRPWVGNIELDADAVFERDSDPAPVPVAEPEAAEQPDAAAQPQAAPQPVAAPQVAAVADLPVDHRAALTALLALRGSVRIDQLDGDSIEELVDGASSRRNQVLMDIGKEFGVTAIDGAQDVALPELTEKLAERSTGYRYPGPVLSAGVEGALTAALGPLGSSAAALAKRVTGHWGLGAGWIARTCLALALGTRDGASRRGGELRTLQADTAEALIDAAVSAAAAAAGVEVAPVRTGQSAGGAVDAAAVTELREHVEGMLGDQAEDLLQRLGRVRAAAEQPDQRQALAALALLESEHGPASLVAPRFDARRHVMLDSATTWARADVDHLVHDALRADAGIVDPDRRDPQALTDQIAVHRDADPRIGQALLHHRARVTGSALAAVERALTSSPRGLPVPGLQALRSVLDAEVLTAAEQLTQQPGAFTGRVALVTGASPGSIAWATLGHLLRGGATVVVATTTDTPDRIEAYRALERSTAGPGAQLHVVRANLASFTDVDRLLEWLTTPTTEQLGPMTREVKPALWPTLVLPFAAAPAGGELPDAGAEAELTLRLLLLGVQRLVGGLAERVARASREPFTVVLPMSPNHGTFGGDGAYGDAKAALEAMCNRWHSEGTRWGRATRLIGAQIGWVRGTGLMAANDVLADHVESELGVTTFSSAQMGVLIAALARDTFAERAAQAPLRVDLSGGLAGRTGLAEALADVALPAAPDDAEPAGVPALPNLPDVLLHARGPLPQPSAVGAARIRPQDMIVLVGIAEHGPWGGSRTRWEAEVGALSAAGIVELAWRTGLITWDAQRAGWIDAASGDLLEESGIVAAYGEQVRRNCGLRPLADTALVPASGMPELTEIFLERPLTLTLPARAEAEALAAGAREAVILETADGWRLTLPAGAAIRVPRTRPLVRSVGGQYPQGSDPTRLGLEPGAAGTMDPLAAWNIVVTAEALADAGVTPEELIGAVHPSLVGNTQGSGMGGMHSIETTFQGPLLGQPGANDVLQEALSNVVPAHVNQGLVGGYGPMVHPVAACATAAVSLEEAIDKIALGKAEIVVGGGWDDLSGQGIIGFANMAATADNEALIEIGLAPHQHSRPGDRRRRGFVESQGGGSFLVCRGSVALALGLPVRAVVGYAASFGDGIHHSIPAPGLGALGAARGGPDSPLARALADLGLTADDIEVVSKHDTSTEANDPNEAYLHDRIQQALGRSPGAPLRVVSQKSLTGHAKGGAAAWQLAGLCDVFADDVVPGNRNLVSVDPRVAEGCLVVDHRPLRRATPVRAGLLTSLGFGHVSAVVALAHPDVFLAALEPEHRAAYQAAARDRRIAGARRQLAAQYGGEPVLRRRTDRRLGAGDADVQRAREAAVLLDAAGRLPGASGA